MAILQAMKIEINLPTREDDSSGEKVVKALGKGIREGATVDTGTGDPSVRVYYLTSAQMLHEIFDGGNLLT